MMKGELAREDSYVWQVSARARRMRIVVRAGGQVVIVRPRGVSRAIAESFVRSRAAWLSHAIARMSQKKPLPSVAELRADYRARKERALAWVTRRTAELATHYGFTYARIIIRNQQSRWGSCSRSGTLSFNYRILDLPAHLADYLIVHELCHLREMNHSKAFWRLVAETVPEYHAFRRELKRHAAHSVY